MRQHIDHFIRTGTDWLFRRQSPGVYFVRVGAALLTLMVAGWAIGFSFPTSLGPISISFDSNGNAPALVRLGMPTMSIALIVIGLVMEFRRQENERQRLDRKKVLVVEVRGLRDTSGSPLADAAPEELEGHREQVLVDLRQRIKDGFIVDPRVAMERLTSLPLDLERRANGLDRRDIRYVYGGLAPVPLTFLTGVLMDDENSIVVMDWDRHLGSWRQLDGVDDGARFEVTGLGEIEAGTEEVVLAVSVSYEVDLIGLSKKVEDVPLVHMALSDGSPDCHWSESKQMALGKQYLDTVIALGNLGARRIHLFLAAQNSVVFRFGRLYDKRNLPEVVVYQYQREENPPYPWGISMPVSGHANPEVVS